MKNVKKALKELVKRAYKHIYAAISKKGLSDKTKERVTVKPDIPRKSVTVTLGNRAFFANYGRGAGRMPPLDPIVEWCKEKSIPVQSAYFIAEKIGQRGTKGHHFMRIAEPNIIDDAVELLAEASQEDLFNLIDDI